MSLVEPFEMIEKTLRTSLRIYAAEFIEFKQIINEMPNKGDANENQYFFFARKRRLKKI